MTVPHSFSAGVGQPVIVVRRGRRAHQTLGLRRRANGLSGAIRRLPASVRLKIGLVVELKRMAKAPPFVLTQRGGRRSNPLVRVALSFRRIELRQGALEPGEEFVVINGLEEEAGGTGAQSVGANSGIIFTGDDDDARGLRDLAKTRLHFEA